MSLFAKTPMQMRREAEMRGQPKPPPPGQADPAKRLALAAKTGAELDVATGLAHVQAGRIEVRLPRARGECELWEHSRAWRRRSGQKNGPGATTRAGAPRYATRGKFACSGATGKRG